ncbi:hypothetical protein MMC10_008049 [Thelotrema lepadinum]|nr:hypothetical protein [Thelotrema lepadinum]
MPSTINVVDHPATAWTKQKTTTSENLLKEACPKQYRRCQRLVQSSFTRSGLREGHISATENGFVWAAYHAYSTHHRLVIRPEDVWFAILTQMSFYINAHAEELRSFFVDHEGQKELNAVSDIADFGFLAVQMTELIAKNVINPELREWVLPSFTTTTADDKVIGAVLFMGAMQSYFSFKLTVACGIPSVTLLGEVTDWMDILKRLDKIDLLGEEPRQFASMLRPIIQHMILSFESPTSGEVVQFWNTIVHRHVLFSGTDYLSGWLTAFCFWSETGKAKRLGDNNVLFENVKFPTVKINSIPAGFASVPVTVDDLGDVYPETMVAGSVGIAAMEPNISSREGVEIPTSLAAPSEPNEQQTSPAETAPNGNFNTPILDTIQPISGWWIYENEAQEQVEARETEIARLREEVNNNRREMENLRIDSEKWQNHITMSKRLRELEAY